MTTIDECLKPFDPKKDMKAQLVLTVQIKGKGYQVLDSKIEGIETDSQIGYKGLFDKLKSSYGFNSLYQKRDGDKIAIYHNKDRI
jgi:hypothetical protein